MDEFARYLCTKCINEKVEIARSIGAEGACKNSLVKGTNSDDALENNKNCTEEVIFQVKGQRQTKNTFEKKVFFACFFSAQNGNGREKQADSEGGAVHVVPRKKK